MAGALQSDGGDGIERCFEFLEQRHQDLLLAPEMVMQIAFADADCLRDFGSRHLGGSPFIEQDPAGLQDLGARARPVFFVDPLQTHPGRFLARHGAPQSGAPR